MEKKPILNVMVDLETASTKENAAILSWAMVPFSADGSEITGTEDFYRVVSLTSCFLAGMDFDRNTQKWWMEQDPKARGIFLHAQDTNILGVASDAYAWLSNLSEKYDLYLWARGIDFDIPKMEWCFRQFVERPLPYRYSHKMDVRTVLKFMQIDQSQFEMQGIKHNALDDCRHDIRMIQEAYKRNEQRMTDYSALEVKQTANALKEERSQKSEDNNGHRLNFPELYKITAIPQCILEHDNGLGFNWFQINTIEKALRKLKNQEEEIKETALEHEAILNESKAHAEANRELNKRLLELEAELEESTAKCLHLTQQLLDLQAKA